MDTLKIAKIVGWFQITLTVIGLVILLTSLQAVLQSINPTLTLLTSVGAIVGAFLVGIGFLKAKRWAIYLTGVWILITVLSTFFSKVILRSTVADKAVFETSMNLSPGVIGLFLFAIPILLMSLFSQIINIAIFLYFFANRKKFS